MRPTRGNAVKLVSACAVALVMATLWLSDPGRPVTGADTFTVNSADDADDGVCDATHCSLREAINAANNNPPVDTDTIAFDIAPAGAHTISPNSSGLGSLPAVLDEVHIDATTQPGYAGTPLIRLDGAATTSATGLMFAPPVPPETFGPYSSVSGVSITNFGTAVQVSNQMAVNVTDSYLGLEPDGITEAGNGGGVGVQDASFAMFDSVVSGNGFGLIVSGNPLTSSIASAYLLGNKLGTDASGTVAIPNGPSIAAFNAVATMGDGTVAGRNVIVGGTISVERFAPKQSSITMRGNFVGTDVTGTVKLSETDIEVGGGGFTPSFIGGGTSLPSSCAGDCNVITGTIRVHSLGHAQIHGNFLGVDANGSAAFPASGDGVVIESVCCMAPSSATSVQRNIIANHSGHGVRVIGTTSRAMIVENSIYANGSKAVYRINGEPLPPAFNVLPSQLAGVACANCNVHIYSDSEDEGRIYEGTTQAGEDLLWAFPLPVTGPCVSTSTTDANGDTSEFYTQALSAGPNNDSDFIDLPPSQPFDDVTRAHADDTQDACDADDDNDGLSDTSEVSGSACAGVATDPLDEDSDDDLALDGAECVELTNPMSAASVPLAGACGSFFDEDGDGVPSFREVCYYNSDPLRADTDYGADDGCEIATINQDFVVNVVDLQQVAQSSTSPAGPDPYIVNFDVTKDGVINVLDLQFVASQFGPC
jgi:CSLREA domain-containing protein